MGARTGVVLLMLSVAILFDRIVRPARTFVLVSAGTLLFCGFLVFGWIRDAQLFEENLSSESIWSASSEFQSLFGTAYDLHSLRDQIKVPWQVHLSEVFLVIPSQFLPFEKMSGSEWYLAEKGLTGHGTGCMFGVLSQGVIGLDWIEIAARGGLVGLIFVCIHKWYMKRRLEFRPTMLYVFLCCWSYYTFRDVTFSVANAVVYCFLPVMVLVGRKSQSNEVTAENIVQQADAR
jgi:hypothetical protein